jgi:hypothetical protein
LRIARAPTYQAMFRTLIDLIAPVPGEAILDVGCGSGALDRALARRLAGANPSPRSTPTRSCCARRPRWPSPTADRRLEAAEIAYPFPSVYDKLRAV